MWESHLLIPSSRTPVILATWISQISLRWLWAPDSQHPLLPRFFQLSAESQSRVFIFFICASVCVIGPNFLLQFSACPLGSLHSPAAVWWNGLKSASWMAAGGSVQACVANCSVTFMLGAHWTDTTLNYFTVFLHTSLVLGGFMLYLQ